MLSRTQDIDAARGEDQQRDPAVAPKPSPGDPPYAPARPNDPLLVT
jgi:hypothetical protein